MAAIHWHDLASMGLAVNELVRDTKRACGCESAQGPQGPSAATSTAPVRGSPGAGCGCSAGAATVAARPLLPARGIATSTRPAGPIHWHDFATRVPRASVTLGLRPAWWRV